MSTYSGETPAVIELSNIHFIRQNKTILSGIDWRIAPGQHWAIMGANGSGKTTLLKIITGYEWPTFGQVSVLGQRFGQTNIRELRKLVGWVSSSIEQRLPAEDKAIDIAASGIEASLGLFRTFTDAEYEQAMQALGMLNAQVLARQRFGTLSQGEQQKVLIARALVNQPRVLILDEPCAGLDPAARVRFLKDLEHFAGMVQAPSMIMVTHHIEEIGPWTTGVLLLKEGRIMQSGTADEVLNSKNMTNLFEFPCEVKQNLTRRHLIV
ncbi:MAG: ABC transporter ATP-binding protein [Sedimentisphaerales bacterium]|nr:ABC transporter ATP-binding protein [Sedimentisphaerales bacterium]